MSGRRRPQQLRLLPLSARVDVEERRIRDWMWSFDRRLAAAVRRAGRPIGGAS